MKRIHWNSIWRFDGLGAKNMRREKKAWSMSVGLSVLSSTELQSAVPSCDQSALGKTGTAFSCTGPWALCHDTKLPLNQTAVGSRIDIIFNELITYTEKRSIVGQPVFHASRWASRVTLIYEPLFILHLCLLHSLVYISCPTSLRKR